MQFYSSTAQHCFLVIVTLIGFSAVAALTPPQPQTARFALSRTAAKAVAVPTSAAEQLLVFTDVVVEETTTKITKPLAPQDAWVANLDYEGFGKEVSALGAKLLKEGGQDDVKHLNKIVSWRNIAAIVGVATFWLPPNPVSVIALSTWTYASWTMIAHHTCHGGYNRVDAGGFNSRGFALGSVFKRVKDWLDWMHPEAWNVEHNRLHHYRLNEARDPDLVQQNMEELRNENSSLAFKYAAVAFAMPIWKWAYYAPNTFKEMRMAEMKKEGQELPKYFIPDKAVTVSSLFAKDEEGTATRKVVDPKSFFLRVVGPFFLLRFLALPAPLLAVPGVGPALFGKAVANLVLAELLTNVHAFITIVTNHAGEDLYTFDDAVKPKTPSFYVRQIVGSANYHAGNDALDFSHGWLNYQIEHHVWPDLSMLQYQKAAPSLKAICNKYGVPYIQESVFERLRKTVDVMIGKTSMRRFPTEYEPKKDKATQVVWKSTNGAIDEDE